MNIGIIGSGNIGCAIAADLAHAGHRVFLYSSHPNCFTQDYHLTYEDTDTGAAYTTQLAQVSDRYEDVTANCELIFVALPTFLISSTVQKIAPLLRPTAMIGFVPGAGGIEFLASQLLMRKITIFGFERVPFVSRLQEYGKKVAASKKKAFRTACIPNQKSEQIAALVQSLFLRPCSVMRSFISMSLTPTLHVSRLYDLYKDYQPGDILDCDPDFYGSWRDSASEICFALDAELHQTSKRLGEYGISADELVPYQIHYESPTAADLTRKLRSIHSLQGIKGPVVSDTNHHFLLDLNSRYFTESYPYRLALVKGLAEITDVSVPLTDTVLAWYCRLSGKEYYQESRFRGKDILSTSAPQAFGITTVQELRAVYYE